MIKEREKYYLTILNVVACFSVVMLHNNGIYWSVPDGLTWLNSNIIETVCYFAVPVFFMISGVTLIDYSDRYSTKEFFLKRITKTGIPFIFWGVVSVIYDVLKRVLSDQEINITVISIIDGLLNSKYMPVYWFFIPLFAVYLSMPVLNAIKNKMQCFKYIAFVGLIFVSTVPTVCAILRIENNELLIPPIVGGYLLFPILGYLLDKSELTKKRKLLVYLFGIIGLLVHFCGSYYLSTDSVNSLFKGYTNLPSVLYSCAVFVFIKYNAYKLERLKKLFLWLHQRTFGVYLIHIYMMKVMIIVFSADTSTFIWRTLGSIVVFVASSMVVAIIQKIPIAKKMFP